MKKTLLLLLLSINFAFSQESINYQTPSDEILDLVEYDRPPSVAYDRDKNFMLFLYRDNYKSIEDLSQKELRLAGLRINPKKNIGSRITYYNNVKIKNLKSKNPEVNDIIGIPNHGQFVIGDTFTENENLQFLGIPSFAPEVMKKITTTDPMKSKHLNKSLDQFAEEGLIKLFKTIVGDHKIVGVVGILQFDVLQHRIQSEYNIPVKFENTQYKTARWLKGEQKQIEKFTKANRNQMAKDNDNDYVYLIRIDWDLEKSIRENPNINFIKVKETNNDDN